MEIHSLPYAPIEANWLRKPPIYTIKQPSQASFQFWEKIKRNDSKQWKAENGNRSHAICHVRPESSGILARCKPEFFFTAWFQNGITTINASLKSSLINEDL